jgi:Ca2+-binding RTX toxin-like protein
MGDAGWDILRGGSGRDTLSGGQDRDIFVLDTAVTRRRNANVDAITDFNGKEDRIYLDNAIFKALGRKGSWSKPVKLTTEAFWAGHRAHEADDRIIYRKTTGQVFYDADGSGKGAAILIARLEKQLKFVDAGDFFVI